MTGASGYGLVIWWSGTGPYLTATCSCGWTRQGLRTELLATDWDAHMLEVGLPHPGPPC